MIRTVIASRRRRRETSSSGWWSADGMVRVLVGEGSAGPVLVGGLPERALWPILFRQIGVERSRRPGAGRRRRC